MNRAKLSLALSVSMIFAPVTQAAFAQSSSSNIFINVAEPASKSAGALPEGTASSAGKHGELGMKLYSPSPASTTSSNRVSEPVSSDNPKDDVPMRVVGASPASVSSSPARHHSSDLLMKISTPLPTVTPQVSEDAVIHHYMSPIPKTQITKVSAPLDAAALQPALETKNSAKTESDPHVAFFLQGAEKLTPHMKDVVKASMMGPRLTPADLGMFLAQGDQSLTATPIPPVVTGTVDLEEFKSTNAIDLKVSQSRTFKLKNKIVRTSISDPAVAEPVVISENQIVLLGKTPGTASLLLWDDAGNSVEVDLRVTRDYGQLQSTIREIDPRVIVKAYTVGGSERVILLGDVDHPESLIRSFAAANVFMDDRGMNVQVANDRLVNARIGEQGGSGQQAGGQAGQLAQLSSVDRYTFFPNTNNNLGKGQVVTSDGGRVTSLVKVRKMPLIVLHVTFMEMNTTAARELGVQLGFNGVSHGFAFGVGGNNSLNAPGALYAIPGTTGGTPAYTIPPNFISPTTSNFSDSGGPGYGSYTATGVPISGFGLGVLNTVPVLLSQSVLLGAPGGATFSPSGLANIYSSIAQFQHGSSSLGLNPTVNGIISHQRARILAEPTLVTISGERAAFLAGGEIPILQSIATAGAAQQSVTFEPFGLRINMIPMLLENGTINLEVSPEERIISTQFELNVPRSTTNVPGFTTRKTQTIVELKPGQELFIAGLISSNSGREMTKTPVLGEIPVLGALYRSKAFSKNESELVVAVRPEIILPGTPGQLKLPEEIGRVEGPRDMNLFQVEPTVIDERHYTSGRAERHQKTSPTLPEGSPIPDNE